LQKKGRGVGCRRVLLYFRIFGDPFEREEKREKTGESELGQSRAHAARFAI